LEATPSLSTVNCQLSIPRVSAMKGKCMKKWLIQRFLPIWAKETVLKENRALQQQNRHLQHRVQLLESYIRGLHRGNRKIVIKGGNEWTS